MLIVYYRQLTSALGLSDLLPGTLFPGLFSRQASDPTSRFAPFPFRSQEVATSSLFFVVVPGLNSGTQPSLSEILQLENDVLCHSQDNNFN